VQPRLKVVSGVSSTATVHADAAQLEIGAQPTAWRPGEGPALVSMAQPREVVQLIDGAEQRRDITITLVEVG